MTIACPKCKKEFELTEAISHKMTEEILAKNNAEHKEELEKQKKETEEKAELKIKVELDKIRQQTQKDSQLELLEAQKKYKLLEKKMQSSEKEQKEKEEKIKQEAMKEASDKYRLDKLGYEKKIADMQKAADVVQRKGKQGSQELQGEVLELDLEEKLKLLFPYDEFKPVKKGEEGADLVQFVKNKYGKTGSIVLWEFKRTKN